MAQRLPIPGGDDGTWGSVLNAYLEVSLNADGTLQTTALTQAGGEVTSNKGIASGYAGLNSSGLVPSTQLATGTASSSNYLRGDGTWVTPNSGSSSLASDSDVTVVSPANNQVLTYNSGAGKWENVAPAVASVFGRTGAVVATTGDYTASQVTGAMSTSVYDAAGIDQQVVGTTATQTLTNKNLNSGTNTFPTLNQNTTGNAATASTATTATAANGINSATTTVVTNGATAPSTNQVLTATSSTAANWQTPSSAPVTTVFGRTGAVVATTGDYTYSQVGAAQGLVPTAVKTSAYSASPGAFIPVSVASGSVVITLPTAPADKTRIGIKLITTSGSNTVTFNTGGSDVINLAGTTSGSLSLLNQAVLMQYTTSTAIWYVQSTDVPLSQTDTRYVLESTVGQNNGVASLNSSGQVPTAQLPTAVVPAPTATNQTIISNSSDVWTLEPVGTIGSNTYTTSYSVSASDIGMEDDYNSSSAGTATIPLGLTSTVGAIVAFRQMGNGALTVAGASSVTVEGTTVTSGQYQTLMARQVSTNVWAVTASGSGGGVTDSYVTNAVQTMVGGVTSLFPQWLPSGGLSENFPRLFGVGSDAGMTTQIPYVAAGPYLVANVSYGHISFFQSGTAPSGQSHAWVALLNSSGTVLAVTADAGGTAWNSGTFVWITLAFASAYVPSSSQLTYVAIMVEASTMPTFRGMDGTGSIESLAPILMGNSTTTGQTTPPSLGATIGLPTSSLASLTYFYLKA